MNRIKFIHCITIIFWWPITIIPFAFFLLISPLINLLYIRWTFSKFEEIKVELNGVDYFNFPIKIISAFFKALIGTFLIIPFTIFSDTFLMGIKMFNNQKNAFIPHYTSKFILWCYKNM
ncbi:hypothetical protein CG009_00790 [Mesoplasma florum]|nr:hypothetical protein CG009_00790 [Mesoplasma florum]